MEDSAYADYIFQLIDVKLKPTLSKLNDILNVTSNRATFQQGGGGEEGAFLEVNINNPYQIGPMEKNNEKIHLEKRTLEDKVKNLREKETSQKGNIAFGSEKGNVKIVSEKEDELNPNLTNEEQVEQAKCDAFMDELNALNAKINIEEAEKKMLKQFL